MENPALLHSGVACLLIAALLPAALPSVRPKVSPAGQDREGALLDQAWTKWVKFVDRGRLPPSTRNWQRRAAVLPAAMRLVPANQWSGYTRLDEAKDLVTLLVLRGSYADGVRILHLLEMRPPKRPDARSWFPAVRRHVVDELDRGDLHVGIQAALLDKLEEGAIRLDEKGLALSHSNPALAAIVLPLLGSFHGNRFRPVMRKFLASGDESLILAATEGLSRMKSGGSIDAVLHALPAVDSVDGRRHLVRLLLELDALDGGAARPDKERRWMDAIMQEMKRLGDASRKSPLVPLYRTWRRPESVPFLIDELEATVALAKKHKVPTSLVFYQSALHEALTNLTGTFVRRGEWGRWREFWRREGESFVLAKEPKRSQGKTSASGFFGIPVRGRRVLFILDTSGSMSAPAAGNGLAAFENGRTRLARAKQELLSAVSGMSENSAFNVIFFSSDARRWLPGPRPANDKRKKALENTLRSILPDGGTDLLDALKLGMRGKIHPTTGMGRPSVDEIFVLSDGMPSNAPDFILSRVAKWNIDRSAVINTVYLGVARETSPTLAPLPLVGPAAFMKKLAEQNGGKFVPTH